MAALACAAAGAASSAGAAGASPARAISLTWVGDISLSRHHGLPARRTRRVQVGGRKAAGESDHRGQPRGHARLGRHLEVRGRAAQLLRVPGPLLLRRSVRSGRLRRDEPGKQPRARLRPERPEPDHRRAQAAPDRLHRPSGRGPDPSRGWHPGRARGLRALPLGRVPPGPRRRNAAREESAAAVRRGGGPHARGRRGLRPDAHSAQHGVRLRRGPRAPARVRARRGARGRRHRPGLRPTRRAGDRALPAAPDRLLARELRGTARCPPAESCRSAGCSRFVCPRPVFPGEGAGRRSGSTRRGFRTSTGAGRARDS